MIDERERYEADKMRKYEGGWRRGSVRERGRGPEHIREGERKQERERESQGGGGGWGIHQLIDKCVYCSSSTGARQHTLGSCRW